MTKLLIAILVILSGPTAFVVGAQPEDGRTRRAELRALLDAVGDRMAAIPARRECAPQIGLEDLAAMFEADIARSPLSAEEAARIARGIVQLDNFVRYYGGAVADTCRIHDQVRAGEGRAARLRDEVHDRLVQAVTAIQSRLPSSASELEAVFRTANCYHPSRHATVVSTCLREGTPFEVMRAFVHVADDGVIRARRDPGLGRDRVTNHYHYTGGSFLYRNHSDLTVENTVESAGRHRFMAMATRKALHTQSTMLNWVRGSLRRGLDLPSSATIVDLYVGRLVDASRRHAAAWCETTVKSGALLAKAFNAQAPADGDAVRPYADAAQAIRADIERIAVTGSADLCTGANADLRALVGPAADEAIGAPLDIDEALYVEAAPRKS